MIVAAMDHNFAKPASTIFAQVNKFNDVVIFDECFTPKTTPYQQGQQVLSKQDEYTKLAHKIWATEGKPIHTLKPIKVRGIVADISGQQVMLNGRSAWDDIQAAVGYRPVGIKQDREVGSNMIRMWMQYPVFDQHGKPILNPTGDPKTEPKLFISRNCVNLIYALSTAKFKKAKSGSLKEDYDETVEGYEGLLDALRYLLVYLFHDKGSHLTVFSGF
jgi:hypothetical protein